MTIWLNFRTFIRSINLNNICVYRSHHLAKIKLKIKVTIRKIVIIKIWIFFLCRVLHCLWYYISSVFFFWYFPTAVRFKIVPSFRHAFSMIIHFPNSHWHNQQLKPNFLTKFIPFPCHIFQTIFWFSLYLNSVFFYFFSILCLSLACLLAVVFSQTLSLFFFSFEFVSLECAVPSRIFHLYFVLFFF